MGGAVGHNPISIVIPCHRVVGAGGSLTGYAGGVEKKLRLLTLEGVSAVSYTHLDVYKRQGRQRGSGQRPTFEAGDPGSFSHCRRPHHAGGVAGPGAGADNCCCRSLGQIAVSYTHLLTVMFFLFAST